MALHSAPWLFRGLGVACVIFNPRQPRLFSLSGPTELQMCLRDTFRLADSWFRRVLSLRESPKFAHYLVGSDRESYAQSRKIVRMRALSKTNTGDRAWNATGVRLQAPRFLSKVDHYWKNQSQKPRTDIGEYSSVNRPFTDWHQLPKCAIGNSHGKMHIFKMRFRQTKSSEGKWRR